MALMTQEDTIPKMNPQIKKRWTDALRSGEYKQGKGLLRTGDKFCCLGVLCELAVQDKVVQRVPCDKDDGRVFEYGNSADLNNDGFYHTGVLPDSVAEWAGVNPRGKYDRGWLAQDNDARGLTFGQLADIIDREL